LGPKPNTDFIGESLGHEVLTKTGLVKVEKTLQLSSHPVIFAVGDIVDWDEQKQAAKAIGHAPVVVVNIVNLLAGRPVRKEYGGFPEVIAVANGKVGEFMSHSCACCFSPVSATTEWRIYVHSFPLGNYPGWFRHDTHQVQGLVHMDGSWEGGLLVGSDPAPIDCRKLELRYHVVCLYLYPRNPEYHSHLAGISSGSAEGGGLPGTSPVSGEVLAQSLYAACPTALSGLGGKQDVYSDPFPYYPTWMHM